MSELNVAKKTIYNLFKENPESFLIPDYQRPYAWTEEECQTLWDDLLAFAIPDNDFKSFNQNTEYYLGSIVIFKNSNGKQEIIDGQQRITTLMLLLRAFYSRFTRLNDENSETIRKEIGECLWKTNELNKEPILNALKVDSEVATDNDKEEFLNILRTGDAGEGKSRYAENYRFFQVRINDFINDLPSCFPFLPIRILEKCILLPIEADRMETALRIFSTLNDRGLPLSDSDIFKAQFYKFYTSIGKKDEFILQWKELATETEKIFKSSAPMDELFVRYMYYERAKKGIKSSTTVALRTFYEENDFALFKDAGTLKNLIVLMQFWKDVNNQSTEVFSEEVLRLLFILNYAPNSMWESFLSVYFMSNKDSEGNLNQDKLAEFLRRTIAFIFGFSVTNPGVSALRAPIYAEMVNIVSGRPVDFSQFRFDKNTFSNVWQSTNFSNNKPITRSFLTWWAFQIKKQKRLNLTDCLQIEHIYPRNRLDKSDDGVTVADIERLGNKVLLEQRINIRASDYKFDDKKKIYKGNGRAKERTSIAELLEMSKWDSFGLEQIKNRDEQIMKAFIKYLRSQKLLK